MKKYLWRGCLLLIALTPIILYAKTFEGLSTGKVYFYTDGLPTGSNPFLIRLWFYPIIALTAVQFNFIRNRLHGPFLQNLVRFDTRQRGFWHLYCGKVVHQLGALLAGLVFYGSCRGAFGYRVWPPNWGRMGLAIFAFLVLFSLQFVGDLFLDPLVSYILLNVYVFISVSLTGINLSGIGGWLLFPNALMAIRITTIGPYSLGLLVMYGLIIMIGKYRFKKMDLL